jgi:hypothetical protein
MNMEFTNICDIAVGWKLEFGPIRGRIISRSAHRTLDHTDMPGQTEQMFTFILRDHTGEIEVSVFGDLAQEFIRELNLHSCYEIDNYKVLKENQYALTGHRCRLRLNEFSRITFPPDRTYTATIPFLEYNHTKVMDIYKKCIDDNVNILGVCVKCGELENQTTFKGRPVKKRDIWLADESQAKIKVALWDFDAVTFDATLFDNSIVYLFGARIKEFKNILELKTVMNSMILVSYIIKKYFLNMVMVNHSKLNLLCVKKKFKLYRS